MAKIMHKSKVVIVGGGYAGCELARNLDTFADVTLIDPKEHFFHSPAAIRALTEPELASQLLIPYGNFLKHGKLVKGEVVALTANSVELKDGQILPSDITVIATGSSYAEPFKPNEHNLDEYRTRSTLVAGQIKDSQTIAIIGGGPVGVEMAAEIAVTYPSKDIHLVEASDQLFPGYKSSFSEKLLSQLKEMGVQTHLGKKVDNIENTKQPYLGNVSLEDGSKINSDLIIPVLGSRPNNQLLRTIDDIEFDKLGRACHDGWLRPSPSNPSLFVVGDALSAGDAMTIVAISRQAPWLSKLLKNIIRGKLVTQLGQYKPWKLAPILVPLGPRGGFSVLPISKNGMIAGPKLTSKMKGKNLFLDKYRALFNHS